jgi:hypothetical protein
VILSLILTVLLHPLTFLGHESSTPLQPLWGDQPLDLRCLGLRLLAFFDGKGTSDHKLSDIVFFAEVEQLSDFIGTFRTQPSWHNSVSNTGDFLVAFLYDDQIEDAQL